jgi:hypothetical protein
MNTAKGHAREARLTGLPRAKSEGLRAKPKPKANGA